MQPVHFFGKYLVRRHPLAHQPGADPVPNTHSCAAAYDQHEAEQLAAHGIHLNAVDASNLRKLRIQGDSDPQGPAIQPVSSETSAGDEEMDGMPSGSMRLSSVVQATMNSAQLLHRIN